MPVADALAGIVHPVCAVWFREAIGAPTPVQRAVWPALAAGEDVLATAPTGSGKTLAASLLALDRLLTGAWPAGGLRVVYVSPLKALGTDVRRNLSGPLAELTQRLSAAGLPVPAIRIATRSGDTDSAERGRQQRRPPEILVTTPETLNNILASRSWAPHFRDLRLVIVDEIHAVAGSPRGTWLMHAVQWLGERTAAAGGRMQRVGLSATVRPLPAVAAMLAGDEATRVRIIDTGEQRRSRLQIEAIALDEAGARQQRPLDFWQQLAERLRCRLQGVSSTVIFTGSRFLAERLTKLINEGQPQRLAYPHHGSLSRELRSRIEQELKDGRLPAVVATSSLELGLDIGDCQQVLLVQTPSSVASLIQRLGRAGHQVGGHSRGSLFPLHGLDLIEAVVLRRLALRGEVEEVRPPQGQLDVLAQAIVARCLPGEQAPTELYQALSRCRAWQQLPRAAFDSVVELLCGMHRGAPVPALRPCLQYDTAAGLLRALPAGRSRFFSSGGTIPDRGLYSLRRADTGQSLGELDEEFVFERHLGDTFSLGARAWRIVAIDREHVQVQPAERADIQAPFWRNERQLRGWQVSRALAEWLQELEKRWPAQAAELPQLAAELAGGEDLHPVAAQQLLDFATWQRRVTGGLPGRWQVIVERSRDPAGDQELVILHALWGRQLLQPLCIALPALSRAVGGPELSCLCSDTCLLLRSPSHLSLARLRQLLNPGQLEAALAEALPSSGFFGARFREVAGRFLLTSKRRHNSRQPLWLLRQRSKELLAALRDLPEVPVLLETWRHCLDDHFDLPALQARLQEVEAGSISLRCVDTETPSPFCAELVWQRASELMYADDTPEVASLAPADQVLGAVLQDPARRPRLRAKLVAEERRRLLRLQDEYRPGEAAALIELLRQVQVLSEVDFAAAAAELSELPLSELVRFGGGVVAVLALPRFLAAGLVTLPELKDLAGHTLAPAALAWLQQQSASLPADEALAGLGADLLEWHGPCTALDLARLLDMQEVALLPVLSALAVEGRVRRGPLLAGRETEYWCGSRLYRRLLNRQRQLRRPSLPSLPLTQLPVWLARWQGFGEPGALAARLAQLAGFAAAPGLWEQALLPCRCPEYVPAQLDALVAEGEWLPLGCGERLLTLLAPEQRPDWQITAAAGEPIVPAGGGLYPDTALLAQSGLLPRALAKRLWQDFWQGRISTARWQALRQAIRRGFKEAETSPRGRGGFAGEAGLWYRLLVDEIATGDDPLADYERTRRVCGQLLDRYGIVFRELTAIELPVARWGKLLGCLRLMELAGEVTSASFLSDLPGLQFIRPADLSAWLAFVEGGQRGATWLVDARDPASACGLGLPALSYLPARRSGSWCLYHDGRLLVTLQRSGTQVSLHGELGEEHIPALQGLRLLVERAVDPLAKLLIEIIDGQPSATHPAAGIFRAAGCQSHPAGLVLRRY